MSETPSLEPIKPMQLQLTRKDTVDTVVTVETTETNLSRDIIHLSNDELRLL